MKVFMNLENPTISFRMQEDGTFIKYEKDLDSGLDISTVDDKKILDLPQTLRLAGTEYKIDPESSSLFDMLVILNRAYYVKLQPGDPAHVPDIEQLRLCISSGNDLIHNQIILTVFGDFVLVNECVRLSEDWYAVIRFEISTQGNGSVGVVAGDDTESLSELYTTALVKYKEFLITGETDEFCDDYMKPSCLESDKLLIDRMISAINFSEDH